MLLLSPQDTARLGDTAQGRRGSDGSRRRLAPSKGNDALPADAQIGSVPTDSVVKRGVPARGKVFRRRPPTATMRAAVTLSSSWERVLPSLMPCLFSADAIESLDRDDGEDILTETDDPIQGPPFELQPTSISVYKRVGLIQFKEEHGNNGGDDYATVWPLFRNAFCGVAGVALGALALSAFLTSRS
ncbi:hypothetical protein BIW11_03705 [Tropilaelaps mercedesae]|uniref:Uncharacterized protein n=1 Tax=Tropilaelaps mercedesae TaxID=418985 RepID=A0A1V9XHD2_9ACAR|nr:hypothetical protein BIW11_03705 [Tropilaelaps mercedesae]